MKVNILNETLAFKSMQKIINSTMKTWNLKLDTKDVELITKNHLLKYVYKKYISQSVK